jgi:hypothetical protein
MKFDINFSLINANLNIMYKKPSALCLLFLCFFSCKNLDHMSLLKQRTYKVIKLNSNLEIDANWDKPQWKDVESLLINNFKGNIPSFRPIVYMKMMYDEANLYLIFKVKDKYVRCINTEINGDVWEDSCVEFFFAPNLEYSNNYFNLEINCGGTPLMFYNEPNKDYKPLPVELIKGIKIAHSLPVRIDSEIKENITWTLEYKLPLSIINKYLEFEEPKKGVIWKVNFHKIAENNSNPHYITWSPIGGEEPNFHQPEYFGNIEFN